MSAADSATLREDVDELLTGKLSPERFAQRAVPVPRTRSPLRSLRVLAAVQAFLLIVIACATAVAAALELSGHSSSTGQLPGLVLLAASVVIAIPTVAYFRRLQLHAAASRGVDEHYRALCHVEFLRLLEIDGEERTEPIDSEFIQTVVKGVRQTLSQVGVPNAQVCILRIEERGAYVSYYAGYEQPEIAQGVVIADFSAVGSRRVLYRAACPLGDQDAGHQLAVVATCDQLADANKRFLDDVIARLQAMYADEPAALSEPYLP